jgi:hypothetical protein
MESLDRSQLVALAKLEARPAVSVFLPRSEPTSGRREEPTRLRNLLREASSRLAQWGLAETDASALLAPIAALVEAGDGLWNAPANGYAFFAASGFFRPVRLEFPVAERVHVGTRFAVRPLVAVLARPATHYVLALSLKRVRLLENSADGCRELRLPGLPASFEAAMNYVEYYSGVGAHTGSTSSLGRRSAIFHGHGDNDEEGMKDNLEHFFRRIVDTLERDLPDPGAPLVLASVAEYFPLFRRANRHLRLIDDGIAGNPDYVTDGELGSAASLRLAALRRAEIEGLAARWLDLTGGPRAEAELDAIVGAAEQGRVETLLIAQEAERWGTYEPDLDRLSVHESAEPGDEELLDRATARTVAQGGEAYELPRAAMPEGRVAAAVLRYAPAVS